MPTIDSTCSKFTGLWLALLVELGLIKLYTQLDCYQGIGFMDEPKRIKRYRRKGWRMPENTVSITRPGRWGNPFKVGTEHMHNGELKVINGAQSLELHKQWVEAQPPGFFEPLRGKNLACYCDEGKACHGDIILQLANRPREPQPPD